MAQEKKMPKIKSEWKAKLSEEQYNICFLKGTEAPGSVENMTNFMNPDIINV